MSPDKDKIKRKVQEKLGTNTQQKAGAEARVVNVTETGPGTVVAEIDLRINGRSISGGNIRVEYDMDRGVTNEVYVMA